MGHPGAGEQNPAEAAVLQEGEVHIWKLQPELAGDLARYSRILSREEQERADRFRFPHLARNFIVDHGRLRLILASYAQTAPQELAFALNEYGKPELAHPAGPLRFNLSHTEGLSLLAVCLHSPVGIDVEAVRPMTDWRDIAHSHFSLTEIAALDETPQADRTHAFFRCWTRKEAFLKAHGLGLSIPLDSFAVSVAREELPALLECAWDDGETRRWSLMSLALGERYAGALAIPRGAWKTRVFNWRAPSASAP